jgi:hypothetical protein
MLQIHNQYMLINLFLILGAALSAIAGVLHVFIILKGAPWYRFFGAGETFAMAAEQGKWWPHVVTLGIASVLFMWAAYALSGAGVLKPLPFTAPALLLIAAVYLLRGLAALPLWLFAKHKVTAFVAWSSAICLVYGIVHAMGLAQVWPQL